MISKPSLRLMVLGMIISVLLMGCQQPERKPKPAPPPSLEISEFRQLADKLSNQAVKVEGVDNATVILQGQGNRVSAIVGVVLDKDVGKRDANMVMDEVAGRVSQADPKIKRVKVTSDPDLVAKIRFIAKKVADGEPVSQLQGDIAEVSRRIPAR